MFLINSRNKIGTALKYFTQTAAARISHLLMGNVLSLQIIYLLKLDSGATREAYV